MVIKLLFIVFIPIYLKYFIKLKSKSRFLCNFLIGKSDFIDFCREMKSVGQLRLGECVMFSIAIQYRRLNFKNIPFIYKHPEYNLLSSSVFRKISENNKDDKWLIFLK